MPLCFTWTQTWPWQQDDDRVQAEWLDHSSDELRVLKVNGGPQCGNWYWTARKLLPPGENGLPTFQVREGYCATKQEAQEAAETEYSRLNSRAHSAA